MNQDTEDLEFAPAPPDKLYAHHRSQLSAMLDGELSPDQARFMLRRLQHDSDLAECWERWQVCGDVLRGQHHALLPADFSRRVAAAIAAPDAGAAVAARQAGRRRPRASVLRWGGGALAASMALVALFMARQLPDAQLPAGSADMVAAAAAAQPDARDGQDGLVLAAAATGPAEAPSDALRGDAPAPTLPEGSEGALAVAGGIAVAALPRGATERRSRGQSQRAARRVAAASAPARVLAATAPAGALAQPIVAGTQAPATTASMPLLADLPDARAFDTMGNTAFGALPVAPSRPWPRAVLPGLSGGSQPFSARYGLPAAPSDPRFAPFQPRLVEAGPAPVANDGADAGDSAPDAGYRAD